MAGEALPQSTQQNTAVSSVTGNQAQIGWSLTGCVFSKGMFLTSFSFFIPLRSLRGTGFGLCSPAPNGHACVFLRTSSGLRISYRPCIP